MRAVRRVSATFAVALILLGAQASQVLHELVVRHETCPVDGEVLESAGHAGDIDAPTPNAAPARTRLLATADDSLGGHGHDRCLGALGDGDAVTNDVAVLVQALPPDPVLPATTTSAGRCSVPLFRLAPKNSPPV